MTSEETRRRACNVYERPDRYVLVTGSRTTAGIWVDDGEPIVLACDSSDEELGQAVLQSLSASRTNLPLPPVSELRKISRRLAAAGVRSESEFVRDARHVRVELLGSHASLDPARNDGPRRGFFYTDLRVEAERPTASTMGALLRRAFELCTEGGAR